MNPFDLKPFPTSFGLSNEAAAVHISQLAAFEAFSNTSECQQIKQTQQQCSEFEFNRVRWYQYTRMTNEDWIFFQGDTVPHFSANLGHTHITQHRLALVIHMKFTDMI